MEIQMQLELESCLPITLGFFCLPHWHPLLWRAGSRFCQESHLASSQIWSNKDEREIYVFAIPDILLHIFVFSGWHTIFVRKLSLKWYLHWALDIFEHSVTWVIFSGPWTPMWEVGGIVQVLWNSRSFPALKKRDYCHSHCLKPTKITASTALWQS